MSLIDALKQGPMRAAQMGVTVLCVLIAMIDGYEVVAMPFSMPAIAKSWGLVNAQVGYLLSASILGMALGAVAISPLADRIGRRRHILLCLALIAVSMTVSGLTTSLWQLVAVRAVAGLFIGAMVASLNIMVSEYASDRRRGLVMGLYGIGLPLGSALAGYAIAPLIEQFGWRAPFFFGGVLALALFILGLMLLPESIDFLLHRRPAGALATYNRIARTLGVAQVAELPPAAVETARKPRFADLLTGELLPRTLLLWLGFAGLISSFYFANTWTAKIIADATGDAHLGIRVAMLIQYGGVVGAILFGVITLWMNARVATMLLVGLGGAAFYLYAVNVGQVSLAMVLALAIGVCANGGVAAFYAISPSIYPTVLRGTGVGLMIGFGRGVAILAPIFTGYMLSGGWAPVDVYKFFALAMVASALAVAGLTATFRKPVVQPVEAAAK